MGYMRRYSMNRDPLLVHANVYIRNTLRDYLWPSTYGLTICIRACRHTTLRSSDEAHIIGHCRLYGVFCAGRMKQGHGGYMYVCYKTLLRARVRESVLSSLLMVYIYIYSSLMARISSRTAEMGNSFKLVLILCVLAPHPLKNLLCYCQNTIFFFKLLFNKKKKYVNWLWHDD